MFYYSAYHFIIASNYELPEFNEVPVQSPHINLHNIKTGFDGTGESNSLQLSNIDDGIRFEWNQLGRYDVYGGTDIKVASHLNTGEWFLHAPLYGFAMAALLQQNKMLVLHGSAVELNGKAYVIIGGKGHGKSTVTAALIERGYRLLSDDVTALVVTQNRILVLPGIPIIKLWPDATQSIQLNALKSWQIFPDTSKRLFLVKNHFCDESIPLEKVVRITTGEDCQMYLVKDIDRLLLLASHQYFARFINSFSQKNLQKNMDQCASVAKLADICEFCRPWGKEEISNTTTCLEYCLST